MAEGPFLYEVGMAQMSNTGYQTAENWVRWEYLSTPSLPNTPLRIRYVECLEFLQYRKSPHKTEGDRVQKKKFLATISLN